MSTIYYSPSGAILATSATDLAQMLGVHPSAVERNREPVPSGWRMTRIPQPGRGRTPTITVILTDGREALGWREAATMSGVPERTLYDYAGETDDIRRWHICKGQRSGR